MVVKCRREERCGSTTETLNCNHGDTGWHYYGSRYYASGEGRFLSEDPVFLWLGDVQRLMQSTQMGQEAYLSNPQQLNSYSYAFNNPLVNIDVTGEFSSRTAMAGLMQIGEAALGGIQTAFQAAASGMAYAVGYAPLGTVMAVGALGNLDSSFVDSSDGMTNVVNGLFTEKAPVISADHGPIRDIVQGAMGDTKIFDGVALGANVITFTGKETPEYVGKTMAAFGVYQNAVSAGVGNASFSYLAQKAAGFAFEAADIATQIISGGSGILDYAESRLNSSD